ncbi:hypothetical protein SARC_05980 [Sphaeroforma arctica JP610]|uniref:JmjC domain-containing protein n=1 Tax=Sphaeroforma arctica JP610 TaxID=667725 RepID=A0A0L0G0H2_9EUKA|nr:hypothetical protein SARC_05980 [Sphaeroforma arctica JP610]KNC81708.1 hypothetical protein SARC_05980 [Sphaeroforma arctica JP610]|eukprot:XP_014155610.1 hypothetical protein SARC_05980 [Sphaeroforma arctica JP610]
MEKALSGLREDANDFYVPRVIKRTKGPITALAFLRDYVTPNVPVIITGLVDDWPAMRKWGDDDYLCDTIGRETSVTVAATPCGRADAVHTREEDNVEYFVMPEERAMTVQNALSHMRQSASTNLSSEESTDDILYVQTQNGNLATEFEALAKDVEEELPFASEAFGQKPDAVNLWIGTHLSTSSLHKDHYENLYVVIQGEKHFTLLPPTDVPYLHTQEFPPAIYSKHTDTHTWSVQPQTDTDKVPWIPVDTDKPDLQKFPKFKLATPVRCTVKPGEMLYLPAMWYHQVSQSSTNGDPVIAVNYWYDMAFDVKYCYWRYAGRDVSRRRYKYVRSHPLIASYWYGKGQSCMSVCVV